MNINKKAKNILLSCFALLLLSAGIFTAVHFVQANREIPRKEKTLHKIPLKEWSFHKISPMWVWYDIDSAADEATTIVYGTLGPKGEVKRTESTDGSGKLIILEHYREAEIQVIQMIKGNMDAKTVLYWELSSDVIEGAHYSYESTKFLEEGKNYLFFLNKNGAYLSPATVMEVDENGIVIPYWDMRIENEAQALSDESLPVSLDDYIAEIQKYLD